MAKIDEKTIAQTTTGFKGVVLPVHLIYIYFGTEKPNKKFLEMGSEYAKLFGESLYKGADYVIRVTFQDYSWLSPESHEIISGDRVRCLIEVSSYGSRWQPQTAFDSEMAKLGFTPGALFTHTAENLTCKDAKDKCETLKTFFTEILILQKT